MSEENKKIELRSEEVEDILGKVPGWITRNGIVMLFVVFSLLLLGSWIYKVPDVKRAPIAISSLQPPAGIEARATGKIEKLLVSDNEEVVRGRVLAVIENPADFEDVEGLKKELKGIYLPADELPVLKLPVNGDADLGSIQTDYATFYKSYRDYAEFLDLNYHGRKIELLQAEQKEYNEYAENLENRAAILKQEYDLAEKQYHRDSLLFLQNVVSESSLEESKSQMLGKRNSWQEMISLQSENDIRIAGLNEQILELELKGMEQASTLSISMEEALNLLKAAIASWEKQFLIVAPMSGHVTFNSFWSENQNVKSGQIVMTIIPHESDQIIGKIQLPMKGAGEVKIDQPVNIKFDNYPYLEYGMVRARVRNVSRVPENNLYTVEVELTNGLTTFYGKTIDFSQNMRGEAEILTDKMRLIQRIYNPIRNAISRQREM